MGRLLPFQSEETASPGEPRVLDLDDEATDEALSALSSETARKILMAVYDEPKTPPELRDEVGTSLQNIHYHVEKLEDAELIKPAGSGYSEKGTEMTVYAPASEALVLFAGQEHQRSRLKSALKRLLGAIGALAFGSFSVRRLAETGSVVPQVGMGASGDSADGGEAGDAAGGDGSGGGDAGDAPADENASTDADLDGDVEVTGEEDSAVSTQATEAEAAEDAATPTPEPTGTDDVSIQAVTETETAAEATQTSTSTPAATGTPTSTPADTPTPVADTPTPTPEAATATPAPEAGEADTVTRVAAESAAQSPLEDPAVAFFLGGLFMLAVMGVWWYYRG